MLSVRLFLSALAFVYIAVVAQIVAAPLAATRLRMQAAPCPAFVFASMQPTTPAPPAWPAPCHPLFKQIVPLCERFTHRRMSVAFLRWKRTAGVFPLCQSVFDAWGSLLYITVENTHTGAYMKIPKPPTRPTRLILSQLTETEEECAD